MSAYYIDTSAALKFLVRESHSQALADFYDANAVAPWLSSALLRVEVCRTVTRAEPALLDQAREMLAAFHYIDIDDGIVDAASSEPNRNLRSLDAIHLASARLVGTDLIALVTYDVRLREAALQAGIPVARPGAE
ncbi:MAG TPA: type II toxin-antitoxin system VapC family toxin [Jatrophihabitantaceae bacterium]|nr:type II toxin-antitoxin system VapC family toxin [Jatrophihabitantaceae bacterium]